MHTKQKARSIYLFLASLIYILGNSNAPLQAQQPKSSESESVSSEETETAAGEALAQVGPRALSRAFRLAARKATPAVVTILSYGQQDPMRNAAARQQAQSEEGSEEPIPEPDENQLTGVGSGVIVSPEGRVITNNHVIRDAKRVVVQLFDETEIEATDVRGDPDSDVATLRIQREEGFDCAEMGNSDVSEIGDWVLAIGSPFRLEATVSAGIISAKNRRISRINRGRLIQTDAAINPGNSGGPLIDLDGRVIAISTAIATRNGGYQGVGFAIPINQAKWIASELADFGKVRRAAIGVTMAELNPKIASMFKLPAGMGVLAYQVIENSAAERAGLKNLDVILEFAGEKYFEPGSLREAVEKLPVGSRQSMKIYRDGEVLDLTIELASVEDPTLRKEDETAGDTENGDAENGDAENKEAENAEQPPADSSESDEQADENKTVE